jgi:hypothetical protein
MNDSPYQLSQCSFPVIQNAANSSRFSAARPSRGRSRRAQQPAMPVIGYLSIQARRTNSMSIAGSQLAHGPHHVEQVARIDVLVDDHHEAPQIGGRLAAGRQQAGLALANLPSVLARRDPQRHVVLVLHHGAVGPAVDPVRLRIAHDHEIVGADVATAVVLVQERTIPLVDIVRTAAARSAALPISCRVMRLVKPEIAAAWKAYCG